MNETMGTMIEIIMKRINDIDQRITKMEESLDKLRSINTVYYSTGMPEPKYGDYIHSVNKEMK